MKGLDIVKAFLGSEKEDTLSTAKDSLPVDRVDRDALVQGLRDARVELATLRALNQTGAATSMITEGSEAKASTSSASSELNAECKSFVPAAQNAKGSASANASPKPVQTREEKPEADRVCVSMWGVKECPGTSDNECVRKHFPLCHSPLCFGRPDRRRACTEENGKWHGHQNAQYRAAVRADKKRKREATEKREFAEYKKWKHEGNLKTPSAQRGTHKPQPHGQKQGHGNQRKYNPVHVRQQKGWRTPQGPRQLNLGDYFPPLPAPKKKSVWATPVTTPTQTAVAPLAQGSEEARIQVQKLLQGLGRLLSSGAI